MKRKMFCVAGLLAFGLSSRASAGNDYGLPGEFLNFGTGARALGMGKAFTGVADDVDAINWNPAGLATFRSKQLTFQYTPQPVSGAFQYVAYSQPVRSMAALGIGVISMNSGSLSRRDSDNIELGDYSSRETAYLLSFSRKLPSKLSFGGTFKMSEMLIDGRSNRGFGADFGAMILPIEDVRIGVMMRNAIAPAYRYNLEREDFPRILRVGSSVKFFDNRILTSVDLEKTVGIAQNVKWHAGVEGKVVDSVIIRAGGDANEITTGLGLKWKSWEFDYAAGLQNLGLIHRAAVKLVFGGYETYVNVTPRVFSPVGLKNKATFNIKVNNRYRIVNWILTIRNSREEVVRSYQGFKNPPESMEWNGTSSNDKPVEAGTYSYSLSVTDSNNVTEYTSPRTIKIISPTPFELEAK